MDSDRLRLAALGLFAVWCPRQRARASGVVARARSVFGVGRPLDGLLRCLLNVVLWRLGSLSPCARNGLVVLCALFNGLGARLCQGRLMGGHTVVRPTYSVLDSHP